VIKDGDNELAMSWGRDVIDDGDGSNNRDEMAVEHEGQSLSPSLTSNTAG